MQGMSLHGTYKSSYATRLPSGIAASDQSSRHVLPRCPATVFFHRAGKNRGVRFPVRLVLALEWMTAGPGLRVGHPSSDTVCASLCPGENRSD